MPTYAAFLGHQPRLSLSEIAAIVPDFKQVKLVGKEVLIFESSAEFKTNFIDQLGGTMFIAKQLASKNVDEGDVPKLLVKECSAAKRGKITFSLRTVGFTPKQVRGLYQACKKAFRAIDRPCRYIGGDRKPAATAAVHDSELLTSKLGCELVLLTWPIDDDGNTELWVGRTIGAQNIDAYTKRDMEKPVRDTTVGLLPPKLAQMLLNLGYYAVATHKGNKKPPKTITVYDPFCGTGVIPMESLLKKWPILASDISQKAVNGCTKNIEWIRKEEKILKKDVNATVWKHDARKPYDKKDVPDVIVTETTLGPGLTKRPTQKDLSKNLKEAEAIEADFLKATKEALPHCPIVCTWPVWYGNKGPEQLTKIWDVATELGYEAPGLPGTDAKSIIYRRPDQFVGREVVLLMPSKS